ncbi:MAG: hypothetical protein JO036_18100 [Candidatus Eremiobacteraeota bacterium]|nr:hypothetical protein [Candidatus Eremiobacteraeota bacterium]
MATRRSGPSITELQEQIFQREGFRVSFERFGAADAALPPYEYPVMAPQGWKVSDWQRVRLGPYVLLFRGVTVYRGDDTPLPRDVKLGHLRDSYYQATYGTLSADAPDDAPDNVVQLDSKRGKRDR